MSDNFGSFKWLTGDVNYVDHGGKWYRGIGPRNYHVIELVRLGEGLLDGHNRYNVELSEVDVGALSETKQNGSVPLDDALSSCGWKLDRYESGNIIVNEDGDFIARSEGAGEERFNLVCLETLHGYGNRARFADLYGNNWRKLIREAVSTSRELDPKKHPEAHELAMGKPANALGTSQRNMMLGIIFTKER